VCLPVSAREGAGVCVVGCACVVGCVCVPKTLLLEVFIVICTENGMLAFNTKGNRKTHIQQVSPK